MPWKGLFNILATVPISLVLIVDNKVAKERCRVVYFTWTCQGPRLSIAQVPSVCLSGACTFGSDHENIYLIDMNVFYVIYEV